MAISTTSSTGSQSSSSASPISGPITSALSFASTIEMQNRLFAELSSMFGREVPLYDKSLLVNKECNKAVCELLGQLHIGFAVSDAQLDKTSSERHGAIRIGKPEEYRWIARLFSCFAMQPHNFYDMTNVGNKSQPIIATAFRSALHPEHRVFTSLLMTNYFDPTIKARIEAILASREVFSPRAKELIERSERQGGLDWNDANELIKEGTERIFKWTGKARDHQLYKDLCDAGFKIAADIACFERHHLNHLTPNTFSMDLYTSAMKLCMSELDAATFTKRATTALERLAAAGNHDFLHLCFKHFTREQIAAFKPGTLAPNSIASIVTALVSRLVHPELQLSTLKHAGFKDFTEGPSYDTPVLLRQDAYKALTEPVAFTNLDGSTTNSTHTARFGEIEQRFYACTIPGRAMYDDCLTKADAIKDKDPGLAKRDFAAYEAVYASPFSLFPKALPALLSQGLVYGIYAVTAKGLAAKGTIKTSNNVDLLTDLLAHGYASYDGLRYEDFLPVSAAGIFASNLNQYGTQSTAATKPTYTQDMLETIMGMKIVDSDKAYHGLQSQSLLNLYAQLDVLDQLPASHRAQLIASAAYAPANP